MAKRYFKLGQTAPSYSDPISKLKLTKGTSMEISTESSRLKRALSRGHITEINKTEHDQIQASMKASNELAKEESKRKVEEVSKANQEADLSDLSKQQLLDTVAGLEGITEEDVKRTKKYNKEALIDFIENCQVPEAGEEDEEEEDEDDE